MAKTTDPVKLAEKRVKAIKGFYGHLWSFILVNGFLLALNLLTSPGFLWALFPILGWGLGLAFHSFDVFGYPGFGKDWEQRMMEKELKKYRQLEQGEEPEEGLELPELKKKPEELYKDDELV
jgi:hypothetical protein